MAMDGRKTSTTRRRSREAKPILALRFRMSLDTCPAPGQRSATGREYTGSWAAEQLKDTLQHQITGIHKESSGYESIERMNEA